MLYKGNMFRGAYFLSFLIKAIVGTLAGSMNILQKHKVLILDPSCWNCMIFSNGKHKRPKHFNFL